MKNSKEQTEKAMKCCKEFLCGECPYQIYDDPSHEYELRCIHILMLDINKLYFNKEN